MKLVAQTLFLHQTLSVDIYLLRLEILLLKVCISGSIICWRGDQKLAAVGLLILLVISIIIRMV